jgi:signal transduction histidine kinase
MEHVADGGLGILATRLGRRFVLMFLGCAFVPLVIFGWLSLSQVSAELERLDERMLHDGAKTAGMGLAAKLSQLGGDVELLREIARRSDAAAPQGDPDTLKDPLRRRYSAAWLVNDSGVRPLWGGESIDRPALTAAEIAHMASGKALVRSLDRPERLAAFAALQPGGATSPILIAEWNPRWLWDAEDLRSHGADVAVFDGAKHALFHTFESLPDSASLFAAVRKQPASGTVEWSVAGIPHVARYWRAFLLPQYGLDVLVVQSRPRTETLAAVNGFTRWFLLVAAGALLFVLVTSLVQIRRTLGPIVSLGAATRRVAVGDFSAQVTIRSRDEFGDLGRAWNHMIRQLAENVRRRELTEHELVASRDAALAAVVAKAEFVTNVSHELRTPMAEILGAAEILMSLDESDPAARLEFASIAHAGAERLSRLVDDVLELGAGANWDLQPTDVVASLRHAISGLAKATAERVSLQVDNELPLVHAVEHRLTDTWLRLLDNAAKFSGPAASIDVRAKVCGDKVVVEVEDRGAGISRMDLDRIFEPFHQSGRDQLIDKAAGTGLGLTIVRNTVQRLGGRIEVDSELGNGATFRVILPIAKVANELSQAPELHPAVGN